MNKNEKKELIKKYSPHSTLLKNSTLAFLFGGLICTLGELLLRLYGYLGAEERTAGVLVTVTMIAAASLLTALGIFDSIARFAGAGTLVPVSGFANSVVSPALDTKSEGFVLGVGAKIFAVAGPVILYGTLAGTLYGLILYIVSLFGGV